MSSLITSYTQGNEQDKKEINLYKQADDSKTAEH